MLKKYGLLPVLILITFYFTSCSSSKKTVQGLYYDPPGSTVTTDKKINPQHKRGFFFSESGLFVSNEFAGARLNDFYHDGDSTYTALIEPENAPINNSAWYAFKIWSVLPRRIKINLVYKNGSHRYDPKISSDGQKWKYLDSADYKIDTAAGSAQITINVGPDTLWVSAQELFTSSTYDRWINKLIKLPFIKEGIIGYSSLRKPLKKIDISGGNNRGGYIVILGRQHPPEVTGAFALEAFVETISGDSKLAVEFRKKFGVLVIPLINPDGVDNGHWRHNEHGVDLNRDWFNFNQPETKAVRDELLKLQNKSLNKIRFCIDFHSTQHDIFYTMAKDTTIPVDSIYNLTAEWFSIFKKEAPDYKFNIDESLNNPNSPTSDEWMFNTFRVPALTYELGDETNRKVIKKTASAGAIALMKLLLKHSDLGK